MLTRETGRRTEDKAGRAYSLAEMLGEEDAED